MEAEIPEKLETGEELTGEQLLQYFPQLGESNPEIDPKTKQPAIDPKTGQPKPGKGPRAVRTPASAEAEETA